MITEAIKQRTVDEMMKRRDNFAGSDYRFALSLSLNSSVYSRILKGEREKVLSEAGWMSLARRMGVEMGNTPKWNIAKTPVFEFISQQLEFCQVYSASRMLCDIADIGKTFTARHYASTHKNAVYVDCSQVKTRQKLVRFIAREFGVNHTGKYFDVYEDLVHYLRAIPTPLIILDEAGDLERIAFLELKALWNATERCVGWYMMGADGLKHKIRLAIEHKIVGYTELFSRYGSRYQKASPDSTDQLKEFKSVHAAMIIKANASESDRIDIQKMIVKSDYSLRRIQDELIKIS